MHSIENFITLYNEEAALTRRFNASAGYGIAEIKAGFEDILKKSGVALADVSFAYVSGSYSRGQQTPYSDVDIECFSDRITEEYQDTLKWNGLLISLSIYPAGTVRGENDNLIDRSWARSCYKGAKVIYDPDNKFEALKNAHPPSEQPEEADMNLGMWKNMRKVIEYRRKLLSSIDSGDRVLQGFAAARFLESYAVVRNIAGAAEISSEKGQFDILAKVAAADGGTLRLNAEKLFEKISLEECLSLTRPFFDDLSRVLKRVGHNKTGQDRRAPL